MNFEICFLTYMARSGSTLLARELDQYAQIGVTIEDALPDGILHGEKVYIGNREELEKYTKKITRCIKFKGWGVSQKQIIHKIDNDYTYPVFLSDFFKAIYELYFHTSTPEIIIHKKGRYYLKVDEIRKNFPTVKFLHLVRDPRAVYNSQKKSTDSVTKKPMASNIVAFCLNYRKMHEVINKYKKRDYFKRIYYEDIVDNKVDVIRDILKFLELSNTSKLLSDYYDKIPENQRYLHENLTRGLLTSRKTSWKEELSSLEISILENCLRREMREDGYALSKRNPENIFQYMRMILLISVFFLKYYASKFFPAIYLKLKQIRNKSIE